MIAFLIWPLMLALNHSGSKDQLCGAYMAVLEGEEPNCRLEYN